MKTFQNRQSGRKNARRQSTARWLHGVLAVLLTFAANRSAVAQDSAGWRKAEPGWQFEWPRDHAVHPDFKTEWWYFTGNLRAADGRRFGYQLTFFRQGVRAPGNRVKAQSRFVLDDLHFGHFAITDIAGQRFHFAQRLLRGAFGEAGFGGTEGDTRLAWLGDWSLKTDEKGAMHFHAKDGPRTLALELRSTKPWVLHGDAGWSVKADVPGHASQYYSGTRLASKGTLQIDGRSLEVEGESWFDHEWATNQLAPGQIGWDWFSVQLDDGTELMIYQLRKKDGSADGASSGSFIAADGSVRHLSASEIRLKPTKHWESPKTKGRYPVEWRVEIPGLRLSLDVTTPLQAQELALEPVAYWEGVIDVKGSRAGAALKGHGYLELTGYAGELVGLSSPE